MPTPFNQTRVSFRVRAAEKALILRAAEVLKTFASAFVVQASIERAQAVLTDRMRFSLPAPQMKAFMDALDAPLPNSEALMTLFNHQAPGERG